MSARTALVTGANGFVGSHLVRHLVDKGWYVRALVRPNSDLSSLKAVRDGIKVDIYDGNHDSLRRTFAASKPDVIFHLASLFVSEHREADVESLILSNVLFGTRIVDAMVSEGITKLVNTGTAWQHYRSSQYSPVNLYSATKQAFEDILQYYVEADGVQVVTLSLSDTYGPSDPRPKLINMLRRAVASADSLGMSAGEQQIDLVHIDDVVEAFRLAADSLLSGKIHGHRRFSVTSETSQSLREIVGLIEAIIKRDLPIAWGARAYRKREVFRPIVGEVLPGWSARITLKDGLTQIFSSKDERRE
jgi:nucleoside-diphosphate-sugar epimerase